MEREFKDAKELVQCAQWTNKDLPEYIVRPILQQIPSLAIRKTRLRRHEANSLGTKNLSMHQITSIKEL